MESEIPKPQEMPSLLPQPTPRKRRISAKKITVIVITVVIAGLLVYQQLEIISLLRQNKDLKSSLSQKEQEYNTLNNNFQTLQQDYDNLQGRYNRLNTNYADLEAEYQGALKVPYTTIQEGNVTWVFKILDGSIEKWFMPLETYTYYVNKPKPTEYHLLTTNGEIFTVRNMELFVQPEFFGNVIHDITNGNNARDFVQEVFNLRVQLTLYSSDITDTPQWSAETMTEGTGDCEDFAILMGSLLLAGNDDANYGMKVQMVYMDAYNPADPQTVNHVLLYITYPDGTGQLVDSTSTHVLSPWERVVGWYYDLI